MSRDAGSMIPRPTGVFNPDSLLNKSPRQNLTNAIRPGTAKRPGFARSVDVPAPAPRTSFVAPTPGPRHRPPCFAISQPIDLTSTVMPVRLPTQAAWSITNAHQSATR